MHLQGLTQLHPGEQSFLAAKGTARDDGQVDDPPLADFEAQIMKYRGVQEEIQVLSWHQASRC